MKPLKLITSILFAIAIAMYAAPLFADAYMDVASIYQLVAFALVALLFVSLLVKMPKGASLMAVQVEIWQKDIIDNLFKNNDFAAKAVNEDQYVIGGKIVHIPVAGAPDKSFKNLDTFPQNAVKRADDEILYGLDTYYQKPKFVEKVEQYELSYDKRQSVMGEQQSQLIEDAMEGLLYRWSKTGKLMDTPIGYFLTEGAATSEDVLDGATGQRKTFTKATLSKVKKKMDNAKIASTGRIVLVTANHHQQFIDSLTATEQTNFYRIADLSKGIVGTYLNFTFMMRPTVQRWRKTANVWAPVDEQDTAFAAGTDDSAASLIFQENAVSRARGEVNVFDSQGRPEYYGDLFSMNMRLGGRVRRAAGVYAIIEDIVAA